MLVQGLIAFSLGGQFPEHVPRSCHQPTSRAMRSPQIPLKVAVSQPVSVFPRAPVITAASCESGSGYVKGKTQSPAGDSPASAHEPFATRQVRRGGTAATLGTHHPPSALPDGIPIPQADWQTGAGELQDSLCLASEQVNLCEALHTPGLL